MRVVMMRIGELIGVIVAAGKRPGGGDGDKWPAPDPDLGQWLAEARRIERAQLDVDVDEEAW